MAVPIKVDVTDVKQVAAMLARFDAAFGGIDVLVNNGTMREPTGRGCRC
ncbi:SDR family NAD(P)-dependent oxidoreductase [Geminicoccaceae bacterium 1502E]|nr:SDR family NAD(P)-dependent oxidoreductase [Geminicoccaceae bacterium 1502E]